MTAHSAALGEGSPLRLGAAYYYEYAARGAELDLRRLERDLALMRAAGMNLMRPRLAGTGG